MRRAGVQFLAGTNGPSTNSFPGFSLHQELELLVKGGFTPLQALQTATFNPALYMAKLDKYGVVERGRIANMVLLDDNPLSDIRNTQKISGVVLRGTYLSRGELDEMLAHVEQWANHTVDTARTGVPDPSQ
jgi:imidazolonepropionase-like amidohydrolase